MNTMGFMTGIFFAVIFVVVRGCNSANYLMARTELPDLALISVSSFTTALVALAASLLIESPSWDKVWSPVSLKWTLTASLLSLVSVYAALKSYSFIPQWLTQSFIGFEPFFGTMGLVIVARFVSSMDTNRSLLGRLPSNWWLFFGGLLMVVVGVSMMALSKGESNS